MTSTDGTSTLPISTAHFKKLCAPSSMMPGFHREPSPSTSTESFADSIASQRALEKSTRILRVHAERPDGRKLAVLIALVAAAAAKADDSGSKSIDDGLIAEIVRANLRNPSGHFGSRWSVPARNNPKDDYGWRKLTYNVRKALRAFNGG